MMFQTLFIQSNFFQKTALISAIGISLMYVVGCSTPPSTPSSAKTKSTINTPVTKPVASNQSVVNKSAKGQLDSALQNCASQFLDNTQPLISAKLSQKTYPLCFNSFAVMYSGVTRTPIWVAEHLTRQRIAAAKQLVRDDNFHEETRLPTEVRSLLSDYTHTGYDRGHLAPNADMATSNAQYDSFSLANIAPQTPENNRKTWVKIESQTRNLTNKYGSSYVVTGVAYLTPEVKRLKNRVLVPSHFFKAVYLPSQNQATVFISPNDDSDTVEKISLSTLKKRTGVDAFPSLPNNIAPITQ